MVLWIVNIFREYDIDVDIVPEACIGQICSIYGKRYRNRRISRGLYMCRKTRKKINADINASLNIARRLGYMIRIARKIESYSATHNGVKPLIPCQEANTWD
ncbi:MAG: zinc ribbon domain-containing protein [Desulfurococcales archaeon]|nr:zinc ribbon domain-containing protein [Desulfurococcales archaeon]